MRKGDDARRDEQQIYYDDRNEHIGNYAPYEAAAAVFHRKLLVYPRKLLGDVVGLFIVGYRGAEERAHGHLKYLRQAQQQLRVRTDSPFSHLETVCLTTFSRAASSS